MPNIEVNDDQIVECLDKISPVARRRALQKLLAGWEMFDRLVDRNRDKFKEICQKQGLDFDDMTEEERLAFVDKLLHEESSQ